MQSDASLGKPRGDFEIEIYSVSFALRVGMARRDLCRPEYKIRDVMLIRSWVFVVNICITTVTVATDDGNALRGAFINFIERHFRKSFSMAPMTFGGSDN